MLKFQFKPTTIFDFMSGKSRCSKVITIKKICSGANITLQEFFARDYFNDMMMYINKKTALRGFLMGIIFLSSPDFTIKALIFGDMTCEQVLDLFIFCAGVMLRNHPEFIQHRFREPKRKTCIILFHKIPLL